MIVLVRRLVAGLVALCLAFAIGLVGADAAVADTTGSIQGVVTAPDGSVPDGYTYVSLYSPTTGAGGSAIADQTTGAFEFDGLAPGAWRLDVHYQGTHEYLPYLWGNGSWFFTSDAVNDTAVAAGAPTQLPLRLVAGANLSGHLTGSSGSLDNASIQLRLNGQANPPGTNGTFDAATQTWTASNVGPGSYTASFSTTTGSYATQFWNQKATRPSATPLIVAEGAQITGEDVTLQAAATIQGTLQEDADGTLRAPSSPYDVHAYEDAGAVPQDSAPVSTISDAQGHFLLTGLAPGTWRICVTSPLAYASICTSQLIVAAGAIITNTNLTLPVSGYLEMFVYAGNGPADVSAGLYRLNTLTSSWEFSSSVRSDGAGRTNFSNVAPGDYQIDFLSNDRGFDSQWYGGDQTQASATTIHVGSGQEVRLPATDLSVRDFIVLRTSGADRYEGAVKMSEANYDTVPPAGVPVVYVANGANYPDALSAGPAAIAEDGVLLLVTTTSIPTVVANELTRLHPQAIKIAGGPGSVNDDVMVHLEHFVDHPADVTRLAGADRYEASRAIALDAFGDSGARNVFIATGRNYPDALTAGPAAGKAGGPVILVDGLQSTIDTATAHLIQTLGANTVYIAGGPASVTPGIEQSLEDLGLPTLRFSGATRYDVSVQIARYFQGNGDADFLATGLNFPDALAGAPLAQANSGPILLSATTCIPEAVLEQLGDNAGTRFVWLLGGPGSLSDAVYNLQGCSY